MIFSSSYINSCGGSFVPLPSTRITKNKVFRAGGKTETFSTYADVFTNGIPFARRVRTRCMLRMNCYLSLNGVKRHVLSAALLSGVVVSSLLFPLSPSQSFCTLVVSNGIIIIIQPRVKFDGACWILDYSIIYITFQSRGNRKLNAARILHPMVNASTWKSSNRKDKIVGHIRIQTKHDISRQKKGKIMLKLVSCWALSLCGSNSPNCNFSFANAYYVNRRNEIFISFPTINLSSHRVHLARNEIPKKNAEQWKRKRERKKKIQLNRDLVCAVCVRNALRCAHRILCTSVICLFSLV